MNVVLDPNTVARPIPLVPLAAAQLEGWLATQPSTARRWVETTGFTAQPASWVGIPSLDAYADLYARRMGLTEIPHLETLLAYNLFRFAAILQGIAGRVRDGTATNANAAAMAAEVRPLAVAAWEWARRAGAAA